MLCKGESDDFKTEFFGDDGLWLIGCDKGQVPAGGVQEECTGQVEGIGTLEVA